MISKTYTVERACLSRGAFWVTIKGHPRSYQTDTPLNEGDAVTLQNGRAEKAR